MNHIVEQYQPVDIKLIISSFGPTEFYEEVHALFKGPEGKLLNIPGFYNGKGEWIIRFSPVKVGIWNYETFSKRSELDRICGTVECIENNNEAIHGGLLINNEYPHHFIFEDGTSHFKQAYEADWLWALGLGDNKIIKVKEFISTIKKFGFNEIITNIYAHDTVWKKGKTCANDYGPPALFLWEGDNEHPVHDRMNIEFFENFDRLMYYLLEEGIIAHILIKVFNKEVNWPKEFSIQDDLFFKYIVARYQAFPNVIWDLGKEARVNINMSYKYNRLKMINAYDGYGRLLTVHDDPIFYSSKESVKLVDFYTAQQHTEIHTRAIIQRQRENWPVFNAEYSYEHGPSGINDFTYSVCQTPEEVIHRTYEVVMAGAYPAYYYTYTAWDIIDYSYQPLGYLYMKILNDFFTSISWWKFEPHDEYVNGEVRCLAIPDKDYIIYTGKVKKVRMRIRKPDIINAYWINVFTGEKITHKEPVGIDIPSNSIEVKSPFEDAPAIFHLKV